MPPVYLTGGISITGGSYFVRARFSKKRAYALNWVYPTINNKIMPTENSASIIFYIIVQLLLGLEIGTSQFSSFGKVDKTLKSLIGVPSKHTQYNCFIPLKAFIS